MKSTSVEEFGVRRLKGEVPRWLRLRRWQMQINSLNEMVSGALVNCSSQEEDGNLRLIIPEKAEIFHV
jgi:hypothetical protein